MTLRGWSAASDVSTRNRSDHATRGRQKMKFTPMTITIITPIAMPTWVILPSVIDAAT